MSSPSASSTENSSSRGTSGHQHADNKKKKETFKGDVDGFEKILQLPSEQNKGVASQYDEFTAALKYYAGREVSPKSPTHRSRENHDFF